MCMERVRKEAEVGGPDCTARLLSSTSSTDEVLPRRQFPPAVCLSPGLPVPWPGSGEAFGPRAAQPSFQLTFLCPFMPQEVPKLLEGRAWESHIS